MGDNNTSARVVAVRELLIARRSITDRIISANLGRRTHQAGLKEWRAERDLIDITVMAIILNDLMLMGDPC